MEIITLKYLNHAHVKVIASDSVIMEMREHFSFFVDGYKFMPAYKNGSWDGQIRLLDYYKRTLPAGLYNEVCNFAKRFGYTVETEANEFGTPGKKNVPSKEEVKEFFKSIVLTDGDGNTIKPRDYQLDAVHKAIVNKRILEVSPTASGKSLIIYLLIRWIQRELPDDQKFVLIVPRTQLVEQMYTDFAEYSKNDENWDVEDHCHRIYSGKDKHTDCEIIITTWQSIKSMPKGFKKTVYGMIGDEAHTFAAKVLTSIMDGMTNASWRIGLTGTLKGTKVNQMYLNGLFGEVVKIVSTKELMDQGYVAKLKIGVLLCEYPNELRKSLGKIKYQDEIKFLNNYKPRTNFIAKLALSQEGNTLVAFRMIDHGKSIYEKIKELEPDRKVFYVSGETKTAVREETRKIIEGEENAIIVASVVFLTGVNIKNLHNIIFAAPSKSLITVLQTIGRGLRLSKNQAATKLFDIVDDLSWKSRKNFALNHGIERMKIYAKEKFDYKTYNIKFS